MNGATVANWKLYINGVQVSAPLEGGSVSTLSGSGISNNVPLAIGYRTSGNYFSGLIGRVLIYRKALSDSEVAQNFNSIEIGITFNYGPFSFTINCIRTSTSYIDWICR
jgi:hypothetical protein